MNTQWEYRRAIYAVVGDWVKRDNGEQGVVVEEGCNYVIIKWLYKNCDPIKPRIKRAHRVDLTIIDPIK